jgi:hypothetical protein
MIKCSGSKLLLVALDMKIMLQSATALLAGFITIFLLSIVTDVLLEKNGYLTIAPFSHNAGWVIALVLICRSLYFVLGGFLTARLAPNHPMRHAVIIGYVGVALNILGAVMTWDAAPHGFSLSLISLAFLCSWLGGILAGRSRDGARAANAA